VARPFAPSGCHLCHGVVSIGMSEITSGEEVGVSADGIVLFATHTDTRVRLNPGAARRIAEATNGRAYLILDGVRGTHDATILNVFLHLPGDPPDHGLSAGGAALYGLRRASKGEGLTPILVVTSFFQGLNHAAADEIIVSFRINPPLPPDDPITIRRIALVYEDYTPAAAKG
jgi:hypothetical protein